MSITRVIPISLSTEVSESTSADVVISSVTYPDSANGASFSGGNSADVGDLTQERRSTAGQSSTTNGYTSGGFALPSITYNTIDKFPFASNANATDVGDLTQGRYKCAGQQV